MSFGPITPPQFDPHAEGIDGPTPEAFSDPEISRLDLMENRPWVREHVSRRVHVEPKRSRAIVTVPPVAHRARKERHPLAWIAGILALIVFALLGLAAVMFL
jgi:hypothetical protein